MRRARTVRWQSSRSRADSNGAPATGWPGPRRTRSAADASGRLHQAPMFERDGATSDAADHLPVVSGDEPRCSAGVDVAEQVHDIDREVRLEIAGRLVGQD